MRPSHFVLIFFLLLTTTRVMYHISGDFCSSCSLPQNPVSERRGIAGTLFSMQFPNRKFGHWKNRVLHAELNGVGVVEKPMALSYAASRINLDDNIIYHIDYHGVTTHPNPTPKHPKP